MAVRIQLFILTSLLYTRKVEGLSFQPQLWCKIESKSVVHQVSSKKEVHSIYFTLLCINMQLGTY